MSKYGMSQKDYKVWSEKDPWQPYGDWLEYSWENWVNGDFDYAYMYFPNERVAKAYFAAHKITNYYLETV